MAYFVIEGRLPGLNELIAAERSNRYKGAQIKKVAQTHVCAAIREQLDGVRFERPVRIMYHFFEANRRRDKDNVAGFAHKVIQDSLVLCGVLANDGWGQVVGFSDDFAVDSKRPRIIVHIEEVE